MGRGCLAPLSHDTFPHAMGNLCLFSAFIQTWKIDLTLLMTSSDVEAGSDRVEVRALWDVLDEDHPTRGSVLRGDLALVSIQALRFDRSGNLTNMPVIAFHAQVLEWTLDNERPECEHFC
jgi:hypothetical protein